MNRRRSHLEMLACALLVAALAVQPAAGENNGKAPNANANANANAAGPPANPGPPADTPGNGPPDSVPAATPEEHDGGGPPQMPPTAQGTPAGGPNAPSAGEENASREPTPAPSAARSASGSASSSSAGETPAPATVVAPPAGTAGGPASTQEASSSPVAIPDERTAAARRRNAGARGGSSSSLTRPSAQNRAGFGVRPLAQSGQAIPVSALEAPLVTPATEAITRVRPNGRTQTSRPPGAADDAVPYFNDSAPTGATGNSVVEVLTSTAKYALGILGLLVLALGINAVLAAARTRRLERQRERLMEDIGLLQAALLPAVPARLGALLTTVAYRPADGPAAGGDFYDAFALPDGRVGLLLGDVSGHGRQALAKTTLVRFTVRAHLEAGLSPREALAIAGRSLDGRLSDDFATVIAAIHDPVKSTLTYASAGHPPPIIVGPSHHVPVTASSAPPIGVGFPTGQRQTVLPMPEGSSVMIYSDGLLEARIDGVPLGPERLQAWLAELGPDATARAVLDLVVEKADRVPDDLAAVLLHASPGATAPTARIEQLKLDVLDMDGPELDGFLRASGVSEVDRLITGRRVSELLASTSGVVVEVRIGEHPMVSVAPIGEDAAAPARTSARVR
jgi:hypothetical protein